MSNDDNSYIKEYPYLTYDEFTRCMDGFEKRLGAVIRADGSKSVHIAGIEGSRRRYLQIITRLYKQGEERSSTANEQEDELLDMEDPDPAQPVSVASTDSKPVENGWVEYHVVYSPGWRVPVLYLRMYINDKGDDQGARVVLDTAAMADVLVSDRDVRNAMAAVEFGGALGVQDHPVLGHPYMYLHPCHTATLMRTVGSSFSKSIGDVEYLAAWLSLVGPAVGLTLPSVPLGP
ncbi:hypothetical protein IW140_005281 [Coemansia sp. RSA 1813]|nr:hypothetical protein EV178_005779 [Coemansia sp. RSA 1646]KAJ1768781.1 hypothetical protein LPJ74_004581 [Coemansia sp. RSA 1843]KAJ2086378.1 hypothetical protein IW138_005749 [Coemansia sp. RSA 986]KAJ2212303.1 hypothetical protein EV179_004773 [Coemansia sp. RSA 487]KAJ2565592.1 hypothetical protein IW140_005281 [Coemansia sp. RSA 1813]